MKIAFNDTPDPNETEELLNGTALSHRFGLSRARVIEKLAASGLTPVSESVRGGKKFRVSEAGPLLSDHQTYSKSDRKTQAQERLTEANAELKEIEVEKRRGELVPVSDVELAVTNLFRALYLRVLLYCDDSALAISRLDTRGEVAAYQKEHLGKLLQELRADPNSFITKNLPTDELIDVLMRQGKEGGINTKADR